MVLADVGGNRLFGRWLSGSTLRIGSAGITLL